MKIATWNINSVRARLPVLATWLDETKPDVVCLQEIKCVESAFPLEVFDDRGYNVTIVGQKSYNGVAIASLNPLEDVVTQLPPTVEPNSTSTSHEATDYPLFAPHNPTEASGHYSELNNDTQARYVEACTQLGEGIVRICCCYFPNGAPVGSEKFSYKISWMQRLVKRVAMLLKHEEPMIILGDTNIIPRAEDAANFEQWRGGALHHPDSLREYRRLLSLGLSDPSPAFLAADKAYTYWDYQAGARARNDGIRIDHMLMSPQAADKCVAFGVDDWVRDEPRPSDHTPVWLKLSD